MLGIRLFPPQVLSDLNFFRVRDELELALRLRAVQRVAVAAIGTYLLYRYTPLLASQSSHISDAWLVAGLASGLISYTLCSPAFGIFTGGLYFYKGSVDVLSGIKHKDIGSIAWGSFWVLGACYVSQTYKKYQFCFCPSPNLLDKLFIRVADRCAPPLWNRFYKK